MSKNMVSSQKHGQFKHKKALIVALVCVVVLLLIPATALAYVGFVPGVTEAFGINKPVDLGVRYTDADYSRLIYPSNVDGFWIQVSNFDYVAGKNVSRTAPGSKLVVYGGDTNSVTLTQEELTAFVNKLPWTNSPLSHAQIRLSNGTVEFSGNVKAWYVSSLIKALYPSGNYGSLSPYLKLASHLDNPAVYAKMEVSVNNTTDGPSHGLMHLKIVALKVNHLNLTSDVSTMSALNMNVGEASWEQGLGFSLGSLSISNGEVGVYGTIPTDFSVGNGDPTVLCNEYHGGDLVSLSPVDGTIGSELTFCK